MAGSRCRNDVRQVYDNHGRCNRTIEYDRVLLRVPRLDLFDLDPESQPIF